MPLYGYVWEEDGKLVGNLSLIPFWRNGKWLYMIANVAVHPSYRRRGIARQLTIRAIEHIRDHGASAAWLQVREENEAAIRLYHSLGFVERAKRITWVGESFPPLDCSLPAGWTVESRTPDDWKRQSGWLKQIYPLEITWNIPLNLKQFQPGFWQEVLRWMYGNSMVHWSARRDGEAVGVISYEATSGYHDTVWLAVSQEIPSELCRALICSPLKYAERRHKGITMNLPADFLPGLLEELNLERRQTLIWMEIRYPPHIPG
jgi:predicted GNAT family acetyltransferase